MPEIIVNLIPFLPPIVAVLIVVIICVSVIKVARSDQALVVTGIGATKKKTVTVADGQEQTTYVPTIKIAGARLVIPFLQRYKFFDLCAETIIAEGDEILTKDGIPVCIDWVAQIHPNADTVEALQPAVRLFLEKDLGEIKGTIKNILDGGVRAVVSNMSPIEVMVGKDRLDDEVQKSIGKSLMELGYAVELSIKDVTGEIFDQIAAPKTQEIRTNAENVTAQANQSIRETKAKTNQEASQAELASDLAISERTRDNEVKKAEFKVQTDQAQADAAIAGELRTAERNKELAANNGQVEVEKQTQANLAAEKEQEVIATKATSEKRRVVIESEGVAEKDKIAASAAAAVAKTAAGGAAEAAKIEAEGKAEAVKLEASATAERIEKTGAAEAAATKARGLAEAEAIRAKGLAEAEAEEALARARAANDKVNFEITKLEIERDTRIQIATGVATVMANIGEKAQFIDLGGNRGDGNDNVLSSVLGSIPGLMKQLGVENMALNGEPITDTINTLVKSVVDPLSVLNKEKETTVIVPTSPTGTPLPDPTEE